MTTATDLTAQGIAALKAGDKVLAYRLLTQSLSVEPSNELAWLWLSGVVQDNAERLYCLEKVLEINLSSDAARRGIALIPSGVKSKSPISSKTPLISEQKNAQNSPVNTALSLEIEQKTSGTSQILSPSTTTRQKPLSTSPTAKKSDSVSQYRPNWGIALVVTILGSFIYLLIVQFLFPFGGEMIIFCVLGTSIWVLLDATNIGVKRGQLKGLADMGAIGWFFACLLMWIIGFPLYLMKRDNFARLNRRQNTNGIGVFLMSIFTTFIMYVLMMGFIFTRPSYSSYPTRFVSIPSNTGITLAKYTRIRDGMSYSEVVGVLGQEGVEISSSDIAGFKTVMYQWSGNGIANMNAMFQNGKLIQKAQFGLE